MFGGARQAVWLMVIMIAVIVFVSTLVFGRVGLVVSGFALWVAWLAYSTR